jgi:hypothetical protein
VPGRTEKERLQLAQSALNRYDALLSRWQSEPQAAEDVVLARIDRLGALYAHADYPRVISEYQDLTAARHPVPGWAIGWVISAYLQEKTLPPPSRFCNAIRNTHPIRRTRSTRFSTPGWIRESIRPPAGMQSATPATFPGPVTISVPLPLSRTIGGLPVSRSVLTICWRRMPCRKPKSWRDVWRNGAGQSGIAD